MARAAFVAAVVLLLSVNIASASTINAYYTLSTTNKSFTSPRTIGVNSGHNQGTFPI